MNCELLSNFPINKPRAKHALLKGVSREDAKIVTIAKIIATTAKTTDKLEGDSQ